MGVLYKGVCGSIMELTWLHFFIVCPLVGLGGFVDAVAGGGGLISLPAYMLAGVPVHMAVGTNKLSSGMGTTVSTLRFARSGYIHMRQALCCLACALLGSAAGAKLSLLIEERTFKILMLFILPVTAFYVLKTKDMDKPRTAYSLSKTLAIAMPAALFVGAYDGFYGPGTGTFLLLLLTGAAHMKLQDAAGIAKVINLTTNLTSLVVFFVNGTVLVPLGLVAGLFGMLGNYIGATCFKRGGGKIVRPLMLGVLTVFFIKIITELLG